jgi:uncharacterized protein
VIAAFVLAFAALAVPPTPTHYVTDTVNALSSSAHDSVENRLRAFEEKTGDQVIVWIGDTTGDAPLEEWTAQTGHVWQIGHKNKDNGAILFVFMHDRKVRIEVGYGLESTLTDAQSAHIISDTILPAMRRGDVDAAVQGGVSGMLGVIDPSYAPASPVPEAAAASTGADTGKGIAAIVVLFLIVLIAFGLIVAALRRGAMRGSGMDSFLLSAAMGAMSSSFRGGFGGGGGGGFSAGGGNFGGGGASGGW